MSTICGIVRFDGKSVTKEDIREMHDAMEDRGNDAEGSWVDGNVGFGHKMLWTTPESLHENQPFISQTANLIITADARIDNREELFKKLDLNKKDFDIVTDVDLILWSYQKWGEKCPEQLMGDFAFVIWDKNKKLAFCVRDRMGNKQLYYYMNNNILVFSSTIEPLFVLKYLKKELNYDGIKRYINHLAFNRDESFYKDVKRLPSSNYLSFKENDFIIQRYWFPEKIKIDHTITYEEAIQGFDHYFNQAVKSCLRSNYPIGLEVSGGLDSSSVFCLAQEIRTEQKKIPYTLHYSYKESDESKYIEALAEKYKIDIHKEIVDDINYKKYNLDYLVNKIKDWPIRGSYIEYLVKNEWIKKKGIRIVLTGMGGDEVVGGSGVYFSDYVKKMYWKTILNEFKCMKTPLRRQVIFFLSQFFPRFHKFYQVLKNRHPIKKDQSYKDMVLDDQISDSIKLDEIMDELNIKDHYTQATIDTFLSCEASYWIDANASQISESYNFETRHPFLDIRLIEYSLKIPPEYLYKCANYKGLLREVMKNRLPQEILQRNDKGDATENIMHKIKAMNMEYLYDCPRVVELNLLDSKDVKVLKSAFINMDKQVLKKSCAKGKILYYAACLNIENWLRKANK